MNELRINKDKVTHIRIYNIKGLKYYWKEEYKEYYFFGLIYNTTYPAGYWRYGSRRQYYGTNIGHKSNLGKNEVDIKGELCRKPMIEIFFENDSEIIYFDNLLEAKHYCTTNFPNINFKIENEKI